MIKKERNFWIFVGALVVFLIITYFYSNKERSPLFKPSFKDTELSGTEVEHLDSTTLIYSNFKLKFSMDFPDNWELDRGVSEHTVIRGVNADSIITFYVNVVELDEALSEITIWDIADNPDANLIENYHQLISKSLGSDIYDFKSRKVYLSNTEAIEISFNYYNHGVDFNLEMKSLSYQAYKNGYTYSVGLHIPLEYYMANPNYYGHLINKFVIMVIPSK